MLNVPIIHVQVGANNSHIHRHGVRYNDDT